MAGARVAPGLRRLGGDRHLQQGTSEHLSRVIRTSRGLALLLVALAACGCGAVEDGEARELEERLEAELPGEGDVTVDPDEDSVTIEDETGSFTMGDDLPRPDWLDPALPLPEGFSFDNLLTVDEITSARGPTDLDGDELSRFFTAAVTELGWRIDDENLAGTDFWQLFVTDPDGRPLDIELVQGKLAFVTGRVRPAG